MVLGIGVDLVEVDRVARLLRLHRKRFLDRVFTKAEAAYCAGRPDEAGRIAARFAAKEAVMKALGTGWRGGVRWSDIEVTRPGSGGPGIRLQGASAAVAREAGVSRIHLTLTHTASHAIAQVLLER